MLVGGGVQLDTNVGQQFLVGRDDRLAGTQRGGDQLAGGLDTSDDLDDQIDVGVGDHLVGVTCQQSGIDVDVPLTRHVADRDPGDLELHAGAGFDDLGLLGHQADERGADVAAAQHPDANLRRTHEREVRASTRNPPRAIPPARRPPST